MSQQYLELFPSPLFLIVPVVPELASFEGACWLIHQSSGLRIPVQLTRQEAQDFGQIAQDWNWELDEERRPKCFEEARELLEEICYSPPPKISVPLLTPCRQCGFNLGWVTSLDSCLSVMKPRCARCGAWQCWQPKPVLRKEVMQPC